MLEDIIRERKKKLGTLTVEGAYPYPAKTARVHEAREVQEHFARFLASKKKVALAGRVTGIRDQGKLIFVDLRDGSGRIQGIVKRDGVSNFDLLKRTLDIGDFMEFHGRPMKTARGEKSVEATRCRIIAKALRPLPVDFYGLENVEIRLRKRYLDILLNDEIRALFYKKNTFWAASRSFLVTHGFLEVETPVLEATPGGADAEPFVTHHRALDTDFYLRISLEIALKKLLVAGYEKIFEIGRIFRNEGIDAEHLQDYTQLEFYWAYADYNDLMKFVEAFYKDIVKKVTGGLTTQWKGEKIAWSARWKKIDYYSFFQEKTGIDLATARDAALYERALKAGLAPEKALGRGRLVDLLFKKLCRPSLHAPCFLVDPPIEIEPLAKRVLNAREKAERFQVVACGTELGKGFSEANDPVDQRLRFEEQMRLREKGDAEAQRLDEDFLEALEYGMPPAAGFGMSERLFAVLMDKPIRETTIFPLMKRK